MRRYVPSSFERARRLEAYRRLARVVQGKPPGSGLLSLDEVRDRLRLFNEHYVGVEAIRVAKIVGTAGRSEDFGEHFLPRKPELRDQWRAIEQTFPEGAFPPVVVYKVGEAYFVVDGHHRVAIAKQTGVEMIDAEVTELETRFPLDEHIDIPKLIVAEERRIFMEESGLDRARPEANIDLRRPDAYMELLETAKLHGFHLMMERQEVLSVEEIGADWYDRVYLPTVRAIMEEVSAGAFPDATDAELFIWVWQRRRALFPYTGGAELSDAARELGRQQSQTLRGRTRRATRRLRGSRKPGGEPSE